ncbi:hypothetical protein [Robertmurraya siralis]|uniref:hypothetical protein n=1 Tax=Robertmurraya siralis TaxID=77777 RepID=UPI0010F98C66|nr:hypothetical protein [Robertmurraya siralis]
MKLKIKKITGNDLSVDFECTCPNEKFKGTPIEDIMKTRIYLSGYNDDYFFDKVNAEPRLIRCKCGKEYTQQWFRDGRVIINQLN